MAMNAYSASQWELEKKKGFFDFFIKKAWFVSIFIITYIIKSEYKAGWSWQNYSDYIIYTLGMGGLALALCGIAWWINQERYQSFKKTSVEKELTTKELTTKN